MDGTTKENRQQAVKIARDLARRLRKIANSGELPGLLTAKQAFNMVADSIERECVEMERVP